MNGPIFPGDEPASLLAKLEALTRDISRIRAGIVQAEQANRPQGTVWLVYLPVAATLAAEDRPPAASVSATAPTTSPADDAMVSLIQASIRTVTGPLVAELAATWQDGTRKDDIIRDQAETIGRQSAELDAARSEIHALTASAVSGAEQSTPRSPGTFLRAWARLDWLVVALVVAIVVAGLLLVVRR